MFLLIGMNFCGFIVRGFFVRAPDLTDADDKIKEIVDREMTKRAIAGTVISLIFIVGAFFYLRAVYRHWNIWMMFAAAIPMITRAPDLLWEIRLGRKPTSEDRRPAKALHVFIFLVGLANLFLIAAALSIVPK